MHIAHAARRLVPALVPVLLSLWVSGIAAAQPVKVRVGYVPVVGAAPIFVLDGAGWAREAGIEIAATKFDSGPSAIQGLASGTIDVLAVGVAPIAVAHARGLDVKVVAASSTGGSAFVATPRLAQAFGEAGGDAGRAFALFRERHGRPARLATLPAGAVPTVALHHWLRRVVRIDRADVEIVAMGIEAVQQAVLAGGVDGATVLEPALTIVLGRDPRLKAIATADEMFPGLPGTVIAATGSFARARPEVLERLVGLVVRANELIARAPEAAAPHVQAVLGAGLVDVAVIAKALASPTVRYVTDPREIVAATRALLAYQVELGDVTQAPPTDGLFDMGVYERAVGAGARRP